MAGQCPLWVISGHFGLSAQCPLYPQKQTLVEPAGMSALCQKRTLELSRQISAYDFVSLELTALNVRCPVLHRGAAMRRRDFIKMIGGRTAWPLVAHPPQFFQRISSAAWR